MVFKMIFCSECFSGEQIQQLIRSVGCIGNCPVCGARNVHVFNTDRLSDIPELVEWFEDLISIFTPNSLLPADFPHKERKMLKNELLNGWNIFSPQLRDSDVYEILVNICSDRYSYQPEIFNSPVAIMETLDDEYTLGHSLLLTGRWENFVNSIKRDNRYHTKLLNLDVLERMISFLKKIYKNGDVFFRGRITDNDEMLDIEAMGAPPAEKASSGRANAAGIRCLYLASDERTTVYEVRAGAFDNIAIGKFRLRQDISVVDLRAIAKLCPIGIEMDYLEYAVNKEHLQKINREMARGMRRGDNSIDYVATQYISDFIKSLEYPDDSGHLKKAYHGIVYNSTMNHEGYNMAVFDPDVFECQSVRLVTVDGLEYRTQPSL